MTQDFINGYKNREDFIEGYEEYKRKLEKIVGQPLMDFVLEYEKYREGIVNSFGYGTLYKILIELSDEGIKAGLMEELCEEPGFIRAYDNNVIMLWEVPYDGQGELENIMYYVLKGGEYGIFEVLECVLADYSELFI